MYYITILLFFLQVALIHPSMGKKDKIDYKMLFSISYLNTGNFLEIRGFVKNLKNLDLILYEF